MRIICRMLLLGMGLLVACAPAASPPPTLVSVASLAEPLATVASPTAVSLPTSTPVMENTAVSPPTATPQPTRTPTPIPTVTPTATPIVLIPCRERLPDDSLLTIVTQTYGLSPEYEPDDLVSLLDYLPYEVTRGFELELRQPAVVPLVEMIDDMLASGLQPRIQSAYRSYYAQSVAYNKWVEKEPGRVGILSARPGFSEHQLGTTVDFGSPELADIVGDPTIEFHTYFSRTSEGIWLDQNAHRYGYTLSYPLSAFELTGFYYEPWHFRYVGVEMATFLQEQALSLTEYQLINRVPPCIPEEESP